MAVYLHRWATVEDAVYGEDPSRPVTFVDRPATEAESRAALIADFEIDPAELADADILLASYTYENYDGRAFVLFRRWGGLWEVNGSHCSCMGLEDQWEPEPTSVAALTSRLEAASLGREWCYSGEGEDALTTNIFADELTTILLAELDRG